MTPDANAIDTQAIQEALDRRKNGSMPQAQAPQQPSMPQQGQPSAPVPQPEPAMVGASTSAPPESGESNMIVKALIDRLKEFGKDKPQKASI